MVRRLLEAGADAGATLPGGETVLMTAARSGRVGVVRALVAYGADIEAAEPRRRQTALLWAAAEGHVDVVETLIEVGADFTTPLDSGFTPFLFAVREGHLGVVRLLLSAGVDVNGAVDEVVRGEQTYRTGRPVRVGTTPLLLAVTNAHWDVAAALLEAGADPNADGPGYTALHIVPKVRKPGVGDNDPAPDGSGRMTSLEFVRKLVEHGADVDARMPIRRNLNNTRHHEPGSTPFMLASLVADAELMRTLVDLGADPLVTNAENSTPLMAAAGLGTAAPEEEAGSEEEAGDAVRLLLHLGADIDAVNAEGDTAMHGAAYGSFPTVVQLLADYGADIEVWSQPNEQGRTPLFIAEGYRGGLPRPSRPTIRAITTLMVGAGVPTDGPRPELIDMYSRPVPEPAPAKPSVQPKPQVR
jgi:ankyrin repeat protein